MMFGDPYSPTSEFEQWDADDALDALYRAGLAIDHVEQARWPASAPQPRSHRQAYTFRSHGVVDPHLLLVFEAPDALEEWRLWLARYWKARPYLSIRDNVMLLVSRDLSVQEASHFHDALAQMTPLAGLLGSDLPSEETPDSAPQLGDGAEAVAEPGER
jgi:hypothetical protein